MNAQKNGRTYRLQASLFHLLLVLFLVPAVLGMLIENKISRRHDWGIAEPFPPPFNTRARHGNRILTRCFLKKSYESDMIGRHERVCFGTPFFPRSDPVYNIQWILRAGHGGRGTLTIRGSIVNVERLRVDLRLDKKTASTISAVDPW